MMKFFGKRKPPEPPAPPAARYTPPGSWRGDVDWALLREQKRELVEAAYSGRPIDVEAATGLVNLLDAIQDDAAREFGEDAVFGHLADLA